MSKRQRLRKEQKIAAKKAALKEWRERRRLYAVAFPWKKLLWPVITVALVFILVVAVPKAIVLSASIRNVSGPFGQISKKDLAQSKFATLVTSEGDIKFELLTDTAPKTVANFVLLVKNQFYNDVTFHRVIKDFMIQTGDPLSRNDDPADDGSGGPGYTFNDEINKNTPKLVRGIVAMANAGQQEGQGTNGSQFFIITKEATDWLDGLHTPFGRVVEGMDIVDKIGNVKTREDKPTKPIIVKEVILSED
ncbi:peptidylprolyl isomerase [Patescibacteria group bacterium]|nr:peptidylprolyl isomerase [Patescibacteria group bacterium]